MKSCKNDESRNNCHQYIYQVERNVNTQKKYKKRMKKSHFAKIDTKVQNRKQKKKEKRAPNPNEIYITSCI